MPQLIQVVFSTLARLSVWSVIDILLVAIIIYGVLSLFRGTSALTLLYGLFLLLGAVLIVNSLPQLVMLNWLLRNTLPILSIALLIIFQPELRRAVERIGRFRGLFYRPFTIPGALAIPKSIDEVSRACQQLADQRYGALLVLERSTGLQEYTETGVEINGTVSAELLLTLFYPNSPLHDGAVIIRGDRVVAAGCVLPLSENTVNYQLGTRHRAAVGITEQTDALSIIVSEESGAISLANNGRLVRDLNEDKLRKVLSVLYRSPSYYESLPLFWPRRDERQQHTTRIKRE
ncbi:MAG: diadenylate cyclase CdaA [Chloroflexi bacterium]|nr:diadenylate cyclase CdaA [Chloroflexota bacterium]